MEPLTTLVTRTHLAKLKHWCKIFYVNAVGVNTTSIYVSKKSLILQTLSLTPIENELLSPSPFVSNKTQVEQGTILAQRIRASFFLILFYQNNKSMEIVVPVFLTHNRHFLWTSRTLIA